VRDQEAKAIKDHEEAVKAAQTATAVQDPPAPVVVGPPVNTDPPPPVVSAPAPSGLEQEVHGLRDALQKAEARYNVLQGKYNAEGREFRDAIARLEQQVETLTPKTPAERKHLKPEQVESLGEEVVDGAAAVSRGVAEELIAPIQKEMGRLRMQVMFGELDRLHPGWRKVDESEDFQAWCRAWDPVHNCVRQQLITDALQRLDVMALVGLYEEWATISGRASVKRTETTVVPPPASGQVAPPVSKARTDPTDTGKVVIPMSEYREFIDRALKNRMPILRPKEYAEREAYYARAMAEGRLGA
jgi:hypothetical protein